MACDTSENGLPHRAVCGLSPPVSIVEADELCIIAPLFKLLSVLSQPPRMGLMGRARKVVRVEDICFENILHGGKTGNSV